MTRPFQNDPTQFFSVVGAPYVHESHAEPIRYRPQPLDIGVAVLGLVFCTLMLGASLFTDDGAAGLVSIAYHTVL